ESVSIYYAEKDRPILELTKETLRDAADMNRELFVSPLQDSVDLIFFSRKHSRLRALLAEHDKNGQ
ncbi:MAG: hypothetical protein Q8923_17920, partial [Bacillota bacterium]|nr:hypothetical protein [Bacillota bacterium]